MEGHIGFMLVATSLVMLMTPGLAFFYGGLAGKRNILGIMIQTFVSLGITTILWYSIGYSLCFSGGEGGVIGNLDQAFLKNMTIAQMYDTSAGIPPLLFFAYQMMFAIITPALITGAFVNRITFKSYLIFLSLFPSSFANSRNSSGLSSMVCSFCLEESSFMGLFLVISCLFPFFLSLSTG